MKTTTRNILAVPVISRGHGKDKGKVIAVSSSDLFALARFRLHNATWVYMLASNPTPNSIQWVPRFKSARSGLESDQIGMSRLYYRLYVFPPQIRAMCR